MRPLAFVDRMTAAVLHPQQFVLALVEFVIADRGDRKPHHRQRFDGGFVVEHRRQQGARADQVAGGDEDRVLVVLAQLLDQRRHVLGAAGRHRDLFGLVGGIGDPDSAGGGRRLPWKSLMARIRKSIAPGVSAAEPEAGHDSASNTASVGKIGRFMLRRQSLTAANSGAAADRVAVAQTPPPLSIYST